MTAPADFEPIDRFWLRKPLSEADVFRYDAVANCNYGPGARFSLGGDFEARSFLTRTITALFSGFRIVRASSGPMEIALGNHHAKLVPSAASDTTAATQNTALCTAQRGNLLTLHRSRPPHQPSARRMDFAKFTLAIQLEWAA